MEFEEDEARVEVNMASCTDAVVDSGVDSEATTPSSPEDDAQEDQHDNGGKSKEDPQLSSSDEIVLETAETLLALSGKKTSAEQRKAELKGNSFKNGYFMLQSDTKLFLCLFYDNELLHSISALKWIWLGCSGSAYL